MTDDGNEPDDFFELSLDQPLLLSAFAMAGGILFVVVYGVVGSGVNGYTVMSWVEIIWHVCVVKIGTICNNLRHLDRKKWITTWGLCGIGSINQTIAMRCIENVSIDGSVHQWQRKKKLLLSCNIFCRSRSFC